MVSYSPSPYQQHKDGDSRGDVPKPLAPDDSGAVARQRRRRPMWKLHRELAYFSTKHAVLFHAQPIYYYFVTLLTVLFGKTPMVMEEHANTAVLFWVVSGLANFFSYSAALSDPNANNALWGTLQEFWGFAWVKHLGSLNSEDNPLEKCNRNTCFFFRGAVLILKSGPLKQVQGSSESLRVLWQLCKVSSPSGGPSAWRGT